MREARIYLFILKKIIEPLYNSNNKFNIFLAKNIKWLINFIFKVDIYYNVKIWENVTFTHFIWIILWPCEIWDNTIIRQNTTIGRKNREEFVFPKIWNNVELWANVIVLWNVTIWDNSVIWAGSVVISDIPKNSIAVWVPAKVIKNKV